MLGQSRVYASTVRYVELTDIADTLLLSDSTRDDGVEYSMWGVEKWFPTEGASYVSTSGM